MKTVAITGANGLLGQKLANVLSKRNACKVIATGLGKNRNPNPNTCEYHKLDITQLDELKNFFHRFRPSEIINTAAMTNVDACETDIEGCQSLNVRAVRNLSGLCLEYETKLIHLSTDFIFDGLAGPYKEDANPNPLSVYGKAKWEAEKIITDSKVPSSIIRTILLYGWVPNMSRSNIVLWIRDSLRAGKAINLVTDQYRTPTFIDDLADGVASIIFKDKNGIYHISGTEMMSIYELGIRVADFYKLNTELITPVTTDSLTQPAKRPLKTGFITLKAQTDLGYQPQSLEKGIENMEKQIASFVPA